MTNVLIFSVGTAIFASYMFFLVRMIYRQHKKQAEELKISESNSDKYKIKHYREQEEEQDEAQSMVS